MRVEVGGTGKSRDHGNWSQDTLCEEKKTISNKREKKHGAEAREHSRVLSTHFCLQFSCSTNSMGLWATIDWSAVLIIVSP